MRRLSAILLLAVVLVACGSSKKVGSPSATGSSAPPTTSSGAASGYCGLAKEYQSSSDEIANSFKNIDYTNPEKAKKQLADAYRALAPKFKDAFTRAIALAPSELKGDLTKLGDAYKKFLDAMARVNYDFTKIDQATARVFQDPAIQKAAERVGKYGNDHCGIPYTPNGGATTAPAYPSSSSSY